MTNAIRIGVLVSILLGASACSSKPSAESASGTGGNGGRGAASSASSSSSGAGAAGAGGAMADAGPGTGGGPIDAGGDGGLDCTGPFTLEHQQPVGCLPYPGSLWNKQLPANVMTHLATSSDTIAKCVLTECGAPVSNTLWGFSAFDDETGVNDGDEPLYYGQASDPWYTYTSACGYHASGAHDPVGIPFHAPSDALYNTGTGDNFFVVWDQTSNKLVGGYHSGDMVLSIGACPGGGHQGTKADPCPIAGQEYCGVSDWNDPLGFGITTGDSLGSGGYATHVRIEEFIALDIPHAIYLQSSCTVGHVFPAMSDTLQCKSPFVNHGPEGALYFLDYTDAQIAAMNIPDWQKAVIKAMSRYGGYVGDTVGAAVGLGGWRLEGPAAYTYANIPNPGTVFWKARVNATTKTVVCAQHTEAGKGSTMQCNLAFLDLVDQTTNQLIRLTGPGGTDASGHACATAPGCDLSGHIHMADPCVAKALAGQAGGCL